MPRVCLQQISGGDDRMSTFSRLWTLTLAGTHGEHTSCQQLQRWHRKSARNGQPRAWLSTSDLRSACRRLPNEVALGVERTAGSVGSRQLCRRRRRTCSEPNDIMCVPNAPTVPLLQGRKHMPHTTQIEHTRATRGRGLGYLTSLGVTYFRARPFRLYASKTTCRHSSK